MLAALADYSQQPDLVIATQFLLLFVSVESALSMGPMFPLFAAEFQLNDTQLSLLTGACVLALGFANFIIVPCSNIFGRRLTSLVFCLLGIASCIWQALAVSYNSVLAARVVNGIATATSETLLVQVVADMLFLHERVFGQGSICEFFWLFVNLLPNIPKHGVLSRIIYWSYHFGQHWAKVNMLYIQKLRQCEANSPI